MSERMIQANGIEIWTESFGDPAHPTVLLIMGHGLMWPDELCESVADGGRHVIRYDGRDCGRSSSVDFSARPYTLSDLALDAVGVLDAYSVGAGHLVGFSNGGMIAQTAALEHPDRVASLTSWGSTPLASSYIASTQDPSASTLPAPEPRVVEALTRAHEPVDDPEEAVERLLAVAHAFAGTLAPVDEQQVRVRAHRVIVNTRNRAAGVNRVLAIAASPDRTEELSRITAPTLVIHGTVDPAIPFRHGEATARAIPGSRLLAIEGLGHDFPRPALPQIVDAILEHTADERVGGRVT